MEPLLKKTKTHRVWCTQVRSLLRTRSRPSSHGAGGPWLGCLLLPVGDVEAQGVPRGRWAKKVPGHVLQLGVGPQGLEVLHVVQEVRRGEKGQ